MKLLTHHFTIMGMQCADCENVIEEAVLPLPGIKNAAADFTNETLAVEYDGDVIALKTICAVVKTAGYTCGKYVEKKPAGFFKQFFLILLAVIGIALLFQLENWVNLDFSLDDIGKNANYGLLFLIGVLTSFHCIGMCGGFVISYTLAGAQAGKPSYLSHLFYGLGKTASYTTFGALFGLLGGAITFTLGMRSIASAIAGLFLILYGLSMMQAFAWLRRLHIRLPRFLAHTLAEKRRHTSNPLVIGLLNGLMIACGPLQAMYILAAGTGNPVEGAKLLAIFALGTLPVMFAFGTMASLITANSSKLLLKISSIIIILLGAMMLNRSLMMAGTGYDINSLTTKVTQEAKAYFMTWRQHADTGLHIQDGYQVIYMEAYKKNYTPGEFTLRKGIPVKWVINVKELSNCNQQIVIPALKKTIDLQQGLQLIEFVPEQDGIISWSCHMGVIPGAFIVQDAIQDSQAGTSEKSPN